MNIRFLLLCFFISFFGFSQTTVSGKVLSINNSPLSGASIYFNNTTIGTMSDEKGEFQLTTNNGNHTLVVSYLGYTTQQFKINTSKTQKPLIIRLEENTNLLDEVEIKKTVYDDDWKYNLARFEQAFLGRSKLAKKCKIINEKDLHFDFNLKTNTLTATARKPLQIKHTALGYLISYDLVDFTLQNKQLYFSGYAHYKNLRKSIRKKWNRNRLEAFNGSQMHFFRSLQNNKLKEEGFVVNQFKRVLNPKRPSEQQIKQARELIRLHGNTINFSKKIIEPKTPLDSALVTVRKVSLPKYQDFLYKRNTPYNEIISFKNGTPFLNFENHLMVIYTKEPEEDNYLIGMFGKRKKATGVQTSNIVLLNGKAKLDKSGITVNPNAIFNEGYWSFESFANMLPLDYKPSKK